MERQFSDLTYRHINSLLNITPTYQDVFLLICNKGLPFPPPEQTLKLTDSNAAEAMGKHSTWWLS